MLKLAYIGGLGMMAGPGAFHLTPADVARVVRYHDRGRPGEARERFRQAWRKHGAAPVRDLEALVGDGDLDGVVLCAGKNGDDLPIVTELARRLSRFRERNPFILHLSTVSPTFAERAVPFCAGHGVRYANYPLTGGPQGAALGGADPRGMLILAAGERSLYEQLLPLLERLGQPRYFGAVPGAGAVTKLISHHLVFNGLTGVCAAVALHSEAFNDSVPGGAAQHDYLAFLNGGAGGTRQWELSMSRGVGEGVWDAGFAVRHAMVDAIYAAQLALDLGLPRMLVQPMIHTAIAFSHLLMRRPDQALATHAVALETLASEADALDAFMQGMGAFDQSPRQQIANAIASFPEAVRELVRIDPRFDTD
ncbi:MAG: NAD(P)-binding domain-containing protein [Candidatus Sedimenticola endophacoides]